MKSCGGYGCRTGRRILVVVVDLIVDFVPVMVGSVSKYALEHYVAHQYTILKKC